MVQPYFDEQSSVRLQSVGVEHPNSMMTSSNWDICTGLQETSFGGYMLVETAPVRGRVVEQIFAAGMGRGVGGV